MALTEVTPYSTAKPFFPGALVGWMPKIDAERIASYDLYDNIYRNVPQTFALVSRGTEDDPIYIPSARTIVEASHRFLAVGFDFAVIGGSTTERTAARLLFDTLFRREEFFSKFVSAKRWGLVRGDAVWHLTADPLKLPGRRISMTELDPGSYFPIADEDDLDKIVGVHIVDPVEDPEQPGKTYIRRQTYRKTETGTISSETAWFETEGWDDRPATIGSTPKIKLVRMIEPLHELPPQITSLPVYVIRNPPKMPGEFFGTSAISGIERVISGINQGISDEELSLALVGLGTYKTTSGPPVDDDGNESDWVLGPGRVVEIEPGTDFDRIAGITTVTAMQDHLKFLIAEGLYRPSATPDIAVGVVDVQVAESGIARALQMGPLLAKNAEIETEILGVYDHMFFDLLHGWFPGYEGVEIPNIDVTPVVGDPMPTDRKSVIEEVSALVTSGLMSAETGRQILTDKLGIEFGDNEGEAVVRETADLMAARDPFPERLRRELEESGDPAAG